MRNSIEKCKMNDSGLEVAQPFHISTFTFLITHFSLLIS